MKTIICVDDEKAILDSLKTLLLREFQEEYSIEIAESAEEAIELYEDLKKEGIEVPLVISDQIMPGLKGVELLEYLYNKNSDVHTIMLTGLADLNDVTRAVNKANLFRYIAKPWEDTDLILAVMKAVQSYRDKKEIEEKNKELTKYKDHLEKLVDSRTKELVHQKELTEEKNIEITSSIRYAYKLQKALLPQENLISEYLSNNWFIYYQPKDIVSGDFYWFTKKGEDIIIVAADCTGHGVPGAILSIMGILLLDKVVNQLNIAQSDEILNKLRDEVINALHLDDNFKEELKDGMDLGLLIYNPKKLTAQFSGAFNSLIVVNGDLKIYPADRMPIASHPRRHKPFSKQNLKLTKGDMIYLFSDGFIDQFSENNKKLLKKNFHKLLIDIHEESLENQKEKIENRFRDWKGNTIQIDDILILGIRVN